MLIFFGITLAMIAVVVFVLASFANGMSDAPDGPGISLWPAVVVALLSVLCFVLRHFSHGRAIHW